MRLPAVRLAGCFPELFGFVLLDAARLDHAFGGDAAGLVAESGGRRGRR
jgi:hypothetical protein